MSEDLFVRHCSPTLAGIKAGNMFSCSYGSTKELMEYIRQTNRMLVPKGIRVVLLRYSHGRALILVFRPKALELVLRNPMAAAILRRYGYRVMRVEPCVCQLLSRFQENEDFPHEVGLFLGYPPEDVQGFIDNKASNQKCCGCWKVYGDEKRAREVFAKYKICTNIYCSQWERGYSVEKLTVAV